MCISVWQFFSLHLNVINVVSSNTDGFNAASTSDETTIMCMGWSKSFMITEVSCKGGGDRENYRKLVLYNKECNGRSKPPSVQGHEKASVRPGTDAKKLSLAYGKRA